MRQRHRRVPLEEIHADVEIERPVGLGGDDAGIHPQIAVALVEDAEVALALAGDVFHRPVRQRRQVAEDEMIVDAERPVDPVPLVAVAGQRKMLGIAFRLLGHQQFEQVPAGQRHVRQRLAAQRVFRQHQRAVAHLRDIVLVDVDQVFQHAALRPRHMRLDVDRIHVAVFVEREGKAPDVLRRVFEGEVVAERLVAENDAHRK